MDAISVFFEQLDGILGAAFATAISFSLSAVSLNIAAGRWLGFRKGLLFIP